MNIQSTCLEKVLQLVNKGVTIPNPLMIDVGDEVNIEHISGRGVVLYPGCRIHGAETVISADCRLGYEAPVMIDNCRLAEKVELKGGFFSKSVFLKKAQMGSGAQVREGCILEEEARGAHCVGIKQTILFPFVTLGSLINFCDCLMAGGTSRADHSEVGSSYIHFNFTPDGDKTTPSLIGDVPRGVMLNQPAIFLGGQGGIIGPVRMGYGNVVAANSVLRSDYVEDGKLVIGKAGNGGTLTFKPRTYRGIRRIVENNIVYLSNILALEAWYNNVRKPFFESEEFGPHIFAGLMDVIALAKSERIQRLKILAEKAGTSDKSDSLSDHGSAGRIQFRERFSELEALFASDQHNELSRNCRDTFLIGLGQTRERTAGDYISCIQSLPPDIASKGTDWLQSLTDTYCEKAKAILPLLNVFCK